MANGSLDLTTLLPARYRDKTIDSLLKNLFNRHLSKADTIPLFGYVGDQLQLQPGEVQITEADLERQINQLTPFIYSEHATEKKMASWYDLVQKLVTLGGDYQTINQWLSTKSYNFVPPIDLDKFCNFQEYYWIGKWLLKPTMDVQGSAYTLGELGLASVHDYHIPAFARWNNNTFDPEYYVIQRGPVTVYGYPIAPQPTFPNNYSWSDWSYTNLWVHRDDAIRYIAAHGGLIGFSDLIQATRPIIEYNCYVGLNTAQSSSGIPIDTDPRVLPLKTRKNQLPLFDLYHYDGAHANTTSSIFYYKEGQEFAVDTVIGRRLAVDVNNDFIFQHALVNQTDQSLYFYKLYDNALVGGPLNDGNPASTFTSKTIWRAGPVETVQYSKYDIAGTIINRDAFVNYKNYYWTGTDAVNPTYNPTGLPEYYVITRGGTSDWSAYNYWTHVSNLPRADISKYVQAEKPIIEFNLILEGQLLTVKTAKDQLPKFKHYLSDLNGSHTQIVSTFDANNNDAYLAGHLFARLTDLSTEVQAAVISNADVLNNCFDYNSEKYIQGLYTGAYYPTDDAGTTYGYKARSVSYVGIGNGALTITGVAGNAYPELVTFTYNGSTGQFDVNGSVSSTLGPLTIGVDYQTPPGYGVPATPLEGATVRVISGTTPFADGDEFTIEILSYVFKQKNLYLDLDGVYRTLTSADEIYNEVQNVNVVAGDPTLQNGIWSVPPQLEWNVINETRTEISEGDLYYHLISIIGAQPYLVGSPSGDNNWRALISHDVGLGGTIKQFDEDMALLVSMLLQEGISTESLIEFARESYQALSSSIRMFVEDIVPTMLSQGKFIPPEAGDEIDPLVIDAFKTYFFAQSPIVLATASVVDDTISTPFYDTTSALFNLVATLPYLGLGSKVLPQKVYDQEQNMNMLVHHDGHATQLTSYPVDLAKKIVQKKFMRSPGQETPGIISGFNFPPKPYAGQFWFKTGTGQLFVFNAVTDDGTLPDGAEYGSYAYDRASNTVWQNNGNNDWVELASYESNMPWIEVKLDLILQNLELAIEKELYNKCPTLAARLDTSSLEADTHFTSLMKTEFEGFGVKYGSPDVYASAFDSSNSFTWNYSGIVAQGALTSHATWQDIYLDVYGTSRPDLQPWFMAGYSDEASFIAALIPAVLPIGTTKFDPSMWLVPGFVDFITAYRLGLSLSTRLSIDFATGTLLPPYVSNNVQSLLGVPPGTAADAFSFGSNGPIERFWKKTIDYLYSKQKTYFKIDPLTYVRETWGVKHLQVGEYILAPQLGRKEGPVDFVLHGEALTELAQPDWLNVTVDIPPSWTYVYTFTCVSRQDGIFNVVVQNEAAAEDLAYGALPLEHAPTEATPIFRTMVNNVLHYVDDYITVNLTPSRRGFFWGDSFTLSIDIDGNVTTTITPQTVFKAEGLNQLYVQYGRLYGEDSQISLNHSLLNNWIVKLGYRFSGMINTDVLTVTSQDVLVDTSAYSVLVKENDFYASSWLNGLRVQLVKRGSTQMVNGYNVPVLGPNGTPGEDWVFRIDNYNNRRPSLSWYNYDLGGDSHQFIALDGARTTFQWTRYLTKTTVETYSAPFLVTGIQNFINFIFGYADKLEADGWRFNDPTDPRVDPDTQRPISYQLLTEQFIAQQFSGVEAGSSFVFNPFYRKVWFNTAHGVVSDMYNVLGFENETTCAVLDANGKQLSKDNLRVFRQDAMTEMVFDVPVFTLHVLTSEYEHVMLLENYSIGTLLIYDPFLGQRSSRLFLEGEKQANFSGRLDFGGHFLLGDQMKKNLETSVGSIIRLYDTNTRDTDAAALERAQASMGYQKKNYFKNRGTTDASQFRFWQGMIANKGTNFSIDAFVNSASYQDARLDEYWAYKIADYGDARGVTKTELKVEPSDCIGEHTNYIFLEADDVDVQFPFDEDGFDLDPYGSSSTIDTTGMIVIAQDDETRWYSYSDMNQLSYFEADVIAQMSLTPTSVNDFYVITDASGKPVRADCFELVQASSSLHDTVIYRETGDYIAGTTNPPEYTSPRFARMNHSTIQILDPILVGASLTVVAYGPAEKKYSPNLLFNYVDNTLVKNDIIWWDPARGLQHPQAAASIDIEKNSDPAFYTNKVTEYLNSNTAKFKPWGADQIGTIWWNTENLHWMPYSDDKLVPDFSDRLTRWGSLSDMSSMNVYEWVKSSTPPSEASTGPSLTGEPAISNVVKRERTWWQRPVAWRYSANPSVTDRAFMIYQPHTMQLIATNGLGIAVLDEGGFDDIGFVQGTKFSGARYSSTSKIDSTLQSIFGLAKVTSDSSVVVGNYTDFINGAYFPYNPNFLSFTATVDLNVLKFRTNYLGQYVFTHNVSAITGKTYIVLTHFLTGSSQQLEVLDSPVYSGQQITYNFDKLGVTISVILGVDQSVLSIPANQLATGQTYNISTVGTTNFVAIGAVSNTVGLQFTATGPGSGTGTATNTATRISLIAAALGSGLIEMFLRSSVDVLVPINFVETGVTYTQLDSNSVTSSLGWVAWNDPTSNPNTGVKPPLNQYEAMVGDWIQVGSYLHYLAADITAKTADPWTWFDGNDFTPYKSSWNSWKEQKPTIIEARYRLRNSDTNAAFNLNFMFPGNSQLDVQQRASVYVNETKLPVSKWSVVMVGDVPMVVVFEPMLNRGDLVRVKLDPYAPTSAELAFDPTVSDTNPFVLTQYKQDYPYTVETLRDENNNLSITNYYYWVKNKTTIPAPGKLMTVKIAELLQAHDGMYSVPQKLKFYNQLDARPNRYSSLSIKGLGLDVTAMNHYKLRLSKDSTLRESDNELSLKPIHEEWILLRPGQINTIPIELWNTLTDTLAGSTQLNQALPFTALSLYDQRNSTSVSYGFGPGQIMMDSAQAAATVKFTILNTQVDKYVNGALVPDYISYSGFDIAQLDTYFNSADSIRKFMSDLWRNAKPTQINEIFFAVLQDLASKNLEIDRFFKTSFISLSDVKTVTVTS